MQEIYLIFMQYDWQLIQAFIFSNKYAGTVTYTIRYPTSFTFKINQSEPFFSDAFNHFLDTFRLYIVLWVQFQFN